MEPRFSDGAKAQDRAWSVLMVAAQGGDGRAYAALLVQIAPFVRALARRKCRDPETLEDVVQDVLLTVHRVRQTYDPDRSLCAWIAAITARRAIDALRRRGRIGAHETADDQAYETFADPSANKQDAGLASQTIAALLAELPARQRQALELVKVGEMSLLEASNASGQSVGALKVNVHRAIKALRARMEGREP
jgi:RNA polymerase sigma-70 factor (ECF subfamily)